MSRRDSVVVDGRWNISHLKLLFVNPFFPPWVPGGAEHSLEQLCIAFGSKGWAVEVIAVSLDGREGREKHNNFILNWLLAPVQVPPGQDIPDIQYLRTPQYSQDVRATYQKLDHKPDYVIANNAQSYGAVAELTREFGVPAIGIVRDTQMICETGACIDNKPAKKAIPCSGYAGAGQCMIRFRRAREGNSLRPWPAWFLQGMQLHRHRIGLRNAASMFIHLVTISRSLNTLVQKAMPAYPVSSMTTIGNLPTTIEPAGIEEVRSFMASHGLTAGQYFLFAGRKTYGKGVDLVIRAMQLVRQKRPDLKLLLLGRGSVNLKDCEGVIDEPSVSQAMLIALLKQSFALVIPGRWQEGLHRTMIDALQLGLPVVCSEAGAPAVDGVDHEVNGLVVPCNNPKALGEAILKVAGWDQDRLLACKHRGQAIFQKSFSNDVVMSRWEELLVEVIGKRSVGHGTT